MAGSRGPLGSCRSHGVWLHLAAGLTGCLIASGAQATTITVSWSGTVLNTTADASPGDPISGSFAFDDTAPVVGGSPPSSAYYGTNHTSTFSLNGLSGSLTDNWIRVFDDVGFDQFDSASTSFSVYTGDPVNGADVFQIFVRLTDSSATALTGVAIPSSLDSADFDNDISRNSRIDLVAGESVRFRVTSFSYVPVPEPSTMALLGLGLGALARRQASKRP